MPRSRFFAAILAGFAALSPAVTLAQDILDGALSHRIIPGWVSNTGHHIAGLEITLAPGWKTYWRSPGDAGIPPSFDWRGARNVSGVQVLWPAPGVFWESGMRSVGYGGRLVLPLEIAAKLTDQPVRLRGRMDLGVCSDICVPTSIRFDATLSPQASTRTPEIVAALAEQPYSAEEAGLRAARCTLRPSEDGVQVEADLTLPSTGGPEEAVIEASAPDIWVSEAKTKRAGNTLNVVAEMMRFDAAPLVVDRSGIRITVLGANYAVDVKGCSAP